jgi:pimeloyl-ACP methyl ester carboxylesterase
MKKPLHIIYIPGLGADYGQHRAIAMWRLWHVRAEVFPVDWHATDWDAQFRHLLQRIDELGRAGNAVGLVAVSAGASAAINAYAARPGTITGVVCIAGKINHPDSVGGRYRSENPAFMSSVYGCQESLTGLDNAARRRIMSRYALKDGVVPTADSRIPGAKNRRVLSIGHFFTIATQITFGAPSLIRFLKRHVEA